MPKLRFTHIGDLPLLVQMSEEPALQKECTYHRSAAKYTYNAIILNSNCSNCNLGPIKDKYTEA